jgi:hypothetical protein
MSTTKQTQSLSHQKVIGFYHDIAIAETMHNGCLMSSE